MSKLLQSEPEWLKESISLSNKIDIQFWCKMLECNAHNLQRAIRMMGNSPKAVNNYLELNRLKNHHGE